MSTGYRSNLQLFERKFRRRRTANFDSRTRFAVYGRKFCAGAAEIAQTKRISSFALRKSDADADISHAIRSEKAVGGINFTASHNPPEYQGIKFSTADGAPALPEITKQIEEIIENTPKVEDAAAERLKI
jgi:phosphomannomutase